jgi:hypothetical protein
VGDIVKHEGQPIPKPTITVSYESEPGKFKTELSREECLMRRSLRLRKTQRGKS